MRNIQYFLRTLAKLTKSFPGTMHSLERHSFSICVYQNCECIPTFEYGNLILTIFFKSVFSLGSFC